MLFNNTEVSYGYQDPCGYSVDHSIITLIPVAYSVRLSVYDISLQFFFIFVVTGILLSGEKLEQNCTKKPCKQKVNFPCYTIVDHSFFLL